MILHPTLYKDDTLELFVEVIGTEAIMHCNVHKWTKETYKQHKQIWKEVVEFLLKQGFTEIKAARLLTDHKLKRYAEKFGFRDTEDYALDSKHDVRRIMKCHKQLL